MTFHSGTCVASFFCVSLMSQTKKSGLEAYNFTADNTARYELTKPLREISGMAVSPDGRLFAHHDESGDIFQLKSDNGSIVKRFSLGPRTVFGDFEGLAVVDRMFYLVTSDGILYECAEGNDKEKVSYKSYETSLSGEYDVEGLCYDPRTDCLLLACKGYSGLASIGSKAVFAFLLTTKRMERSPRFLLSLKELEHRLQGKPFQPSGIEFAQATGTFFILDSRIKSMIEISTEGKILRAVKLNSAIHKQPEGITSLPNGTLCIGDESSKQGFLTFYRVRK